MNIILMKYRTLIQRTVIQLPRNVNLNMATCGITIKYMFVYAERWTPTGSYTGRGGGGGPKRKRKKIPLSNLLPFFI
jgi:hypothetical protein